MFVHVWDGQARDIDLPLTCKVRKATAYGDKSPLRYTKRKDGGITLHLPERQATIDYIVELETR